MRSAATAAPLSGAWRRVAVFVTSDVSKFLPFALATAGTACLAATSIFRHDHFGSNAYDLGLFDQTVWGYSRLDVIPNTILRLPTTLGDHFHPILMALGPLYWIWSDPRMLLIVQAALLALASLPIFFWARQQLGLWPAVLFQVAYLSFWAVLSGNLFDFHELSFAAPILSIALYALLTRRTRLLLAMVVLGLLTREDLALTFAAIGLYLAISQRRYRLGLGIAAGCLAWFAVMLKAVLPALAGRAYSHWHYPALGSGPGDALVNLFAHPLETIKLFFTPREKSVALFNLFVPWLGLPLLSPLVLLTIPSLAARFFSDKPSYWAQGFHYSLVIAPILVFAAIDTTARLRRFVTPRARKHVPLLLGAGVVVMGLYFSFARLKPLDELERYGSGTRIAEIHSCLATIPPRASVSATSALVPHLSQRRRIYVIDERPLIRARFLALDTSTWIYPLSVADVRSLIRKELRAGYAVRCSKGQTTVLERVR